MLLSQIRSWDKLGRALPAYYIYIYIMFDRCFTGWAICGSTKETKGRVYCGTAQWSWPSRGVNGHTLRGACLPKQHREISRKCILQICWWIYECINLRLSSPSTSKCVTRAWANTLARSIKNKQNNNNQQWRTHTILSWNSRREKCTTRAK